MASPEEDQSSYHSGQEEAIPEGDYDGVSDWENNGSHDSEEESDGPSWEGWIERGETDTEKESILRIS